MSAAEESVAAYAEVMPSVLQLLHVAAVGATVGAKVGLSGGAQN